MSNKLLIIFIILLQFLFINKIQSKEIKFSANEIEVINNGNETIAKNGAAYVEKDKISVKGSIIRYIKDESFLIINEGIIKKIDDNLEITSEVIEYRIDQSNLYLKNDVEVSDNLNNLKIITDEINYNINEQIIESLAKSEIKDNLGNIYQVSQFRYNLKNKVIKLSNLEVLDDSKNVFKIEMAFLDLKKKELIAKDVSLNFKISDNSENEPRLKGEAW